MPRTRSIISAGLMLGAGIGGLIDGVFLIFQVHAMLSARLPLDPMANMQENMTADGVFHAAMLLAVLIGIAMLFAAGKRDDVL